MASSGRRTARCCRGLPPGAPWWGRHCSPPRAIPRHRGRLLSMGRILPSHSWAQSSDQPALHWPWPLQSLRQRKSTTSCGGSGKLWRASLAQSDVLLVTVCLQSSLILSRWSMAYLVSPAYCIRTSLARTSNQSHHHNHNYITYITYALHTTHVIVSVLCNPR